MIEVRKSNERGRTKIDWLDSYHSFSFGDYYDPTNLHFGPLRVLNDDLIQPGGGFPTHPHKEMEIVTIVTEGTVTHKDSSGGHGTISVNEIQRMTAGRGIFHSEFNNSNFDELKLYQIWFLPNKQNLEPSYEQKKYSNADKKNKLLKVVSNRKEDGIIFINQDADIFLSDLESDTILDYNIGNNRGGYIHVIEGRIVVNGIPLANGDAVKISDEKRISIKGEEDSKIILFDLTLDF
jgi:quercetin 2,3-dioxygenase